MDNKIIKAIRGYRKHYKNYISVLIEVLLRKKDIYAILKNSKEPRVIPWELAYAYSASKNISDFKFTTDRLTFVYKGNSISLHLGKSSDPYAVFFSEEYEFLKVKEKAVIDIGTNIGDSPIYFSVNGASKVIGLEPYPYSYDLAKRNVEENRLSNTIELLNCGYGKEGEITVDDTLVSTAASVLVSSDKGKKIRVLSLSTLISDYEIKDADLKMDCEGCEYSLLYEEDRVLRTLEKIQIEYHHGLGGIKEKLEGAGFEVRFTQPKKMLIGEQEKQVWHVGYIYAERRGQDFEAK